MRLDSEQTTVGAAAPFEGQYVVGARFGNHHFQELGPSYRAVRGELLEIRREGEALWAVADDLEQPLTVPPDAVYVAWALKEERHARVGHSLGVFFGGMINSLFESLFDDDDDGYAYASDSSSSSSKDRGKRYARKDEPERVRTRDCMRFGTSMAGFLRSAVRQS